MQNNTWVLVPCPPHVNVVGCMWLFHHKLQSDGSLERYKSCIIANGNSQQVGVDCGEMFSPILKPATIRTVLCLVV